jgi:hypothetical protein
MDEAASFVRFFSAIDLMYGAIVYDHFFHETPFDRFPSNVNVIARRLGVFFEWCTSYAALIEAMHIWSKEAHPPIMQCQNCGEVVVDVYVYICPHAYCQSMLEYHPRDSDRTDLIRYLTSLVP